MKLREIIIKYEYYIILSYILTIIGIVFSHYFPLKNSKTEVFVVLTTITFSCIILNIIAKAIFVIDKETKNEYIKIKSSKLNINYNKLLKKGSISKYFKNVKIIGCLELILIPILTGIYYYILHNPKQTFPYLDLIALSYTMSLMYVNIIRGQIFQEDNNIPSIYANLGLIILAIFSIHPFSNLLNNLFNYILTNLSDSFTLLIAIIMLCVGLSALSFGYCSILTEDSNTRKIMKTNGECYFIASILSMISILLLFITSHLKNHVIFMTLSNLKIYSFEFVLLNVYSALLIIILSFAAISIYYLLKSSISILKELKAFEKFI